jgi:Putative peptidoglycan binding domain
VYGLELALKTAKVMTLNFMLRLQAALLKEGCYCGEMDEEDFYFGPGTQNALLTFQAIKQMPETGIADDTTWSALGITGGNSAGAHHVLFNVWHDVVLLRCVSGRNVTVPPRTWP